MNEKMIGELTLLTTFLGDKSFTQKLQDSSFQKYVVSQKDIIRDILLNGYILMNTNIEERDEVKETYVDKKVDTRVESQTITIEDSNDNISIDGLISEITNMFSTLTGYPVEMLEQNLDLEADLGIDTVKQMEILSMLKDKYGTSGEKIVLKDSPTIEAIANSLAS